ncbi:MAG TPA: cytochrome c biogenesis protein CcdA [Candidatus Baltobacterales bacterium]|nr:cytochrome c biogenesis protein CcdA [Candidatus Baltobacterales bacterium]
MAGVLLAAGATGLDGVSPALAVLAGLVSFVSPCVLPLVPGYLAYLGARAAQPVAVGSPEASPHGWGGGASPLPSGTPRVQRGVGARRAGWGGAITNSVSLPVAAAGVGFVAGLSLVFILFFYVFSLVVQPVRAFVPVVAGIFVIALALHVAGLIRLPLLSGEYRVMKSAPQGGGVAGGFVLGMGFASGWTPCIGVTLSAVLSSAVTAGTTAQGLGLMVAYCLGLGLPFIALAFALESAKPLVRLVNQHRRAIDLASAAVLLVMGVLLLTNKLTVLSAGISQLVPSWPSPTL